MATHGARRLIPMAENTAGVIAIEALAAAQGCDFHAPLASSEPLEGARRAIRQVAAHLDEDRYLADDIGAAVTFVRNGDLAAAAGVSLPSIADNSP